MAEKKSKLVRMFSFGELALTILLSWLGEKVLDYIWEKGKTKIRFEGESHVRHYLIVTFLRVSGISVQDLAFDLFEYVLGRYFSSLSGRPVDRSEEPMVDYAE